MDLLEKVEELIGKENEKQENEKYNKIKAFFCKHGLGDYIFKDSNQTYIRISETDKLAFLDFLDIAPNLIYFDNDYVVQIDDTILFLEQLKLVILEYLKETKK